MLASEAKTTSGNGFAVKTGCMGRLNWILVMPVHHRDAFATTLP
jgi:hypothetical protein